MSRLPAWVRQLPNGRWHGLESVDWAVWETYIPGYASDFESPFPRRNREEWRAHWPVEYGKPPLGRDPTKTLIGEHEVAKAFSAAGWSASWTDTFGSAPEWMRPWREPRPPHRIRIEVEKIKASSPDARPWDVIAWKGRYVRFFEFKQPGEGFTDAERRFIWGAFRAGLDTRTFAVVRGFISFPDRL
jgi:hypothetical protein